MHTSAQKGTTISEVWFPQWVRL